MSDNTPPFVSNPATSGPDGRDAPFRDTTQGGAEAGRFFSEAELPIQSHHGGPPMTTTGYTADGAGPSLPPPGSDVGSGLPPGGTRR